MKQIIFIIITGLVVLGCSKENETEPDNYPTQVTFVYNGNNVTHGVIKKEYYADADGNVLDEPIIKLWLDRNLGAKRVAESKADSLAWGDLFQWGRNADGHQLRTSDTIHGLSETSVPGHNMFVAAYSETYDWLKMSEDDLWNGNEPKNNPCPEGWRVPTEEELLLELFSWEDQTIEEAFNSPNKWVTTGIRSHNGRIRYEETDSYIWGGTPTVNAGGISLSIRHDTSRITPGYRVNGQAVRCIKDIEQ